MLESQIGSGDGESNPTLSLTYEDSMNRFTPPLIFNITQTKLMYIYLKIYYLRKNMHKLPNSQNPRNHLFFSIKSKISL
jgi:hypothetical protein